MNITQEVKFTTTRSNSKFISGRECYQGQLIHNRVLTPKETRHDFAEFARLPLAQANLTVDMLGEFIAEQIAKGNRVDFGPFSVSLKVRGSFSSSNAAFDPEKNEIAIVMTPGKSLKKHVKYLKPVNSTPDGTSRLHEIMQDSPQMSNVYEFSRTGERKITVNGVNIFVHTDAADEGVHVENGEGDVLLEGRVTTSDLSSCRFNLDGTLPRGNHWLVITSRIAPGQPLLRAKRRITVR